MVSTSLRNTAPSPKPHSTLPPRYVAYARSAPSFLAGPSGGPPERCYTASTVGDFLGWLDTDGHASSRLRHGLNALELIELDCMSAGNFEGLGKEEGYALTTETKKTYGRYAAKVKKMGLDAHNESQELERRAGSVGKGGVSSDDPEAVGKLQTKLDSLKAGRDRMKAINAAWRKAGKPRFLWAIKTLSYLSPSPKRMLKTTGPLSGSAPRRTACAGLP